MFTASSGRGACWRIGVVAALVAAAVAGPAASAHAAEADGPANMMGRALQLAGVQAPAGAVEQAPPTFVNTSAGHVAMGAFTLPASDKTLVIGHLVDAAGDHPFVVVLDGSPNSGAAGMMYELASADPGSAIVEQIALAGPGDAICTAGGAGAFWTVVKVIKIGSGLVGSVVGGLLGAYVCTLGHSPEPFGDAMTLNNYAGPPQNEVFSTWSASGPDYTVAGEYHLKSEVCVKNPSAFNDDCYRVDTAGFHTSSALFLVEIFWPDGGYTQFTQSSGTINATGLYYRTMQKTPGLAQGDYVTGFALSEYGFISGINAPTGAARHHEFVTA